MGDAQEREYSVEELTGDPGGETEQETPQDVPGQETRKAEPETGDESAEATPGEEPAAPPIEKPGAEEKAEEPAKPPEGYVKQEALREERERRKELQRQIEELKESQGKAPKKDARELILEDPEQSITLLQDQIEQLRAEIGRSKLEREIYEKVPDFKEKAVLMEEYLHERGFSDEAISRMIGASGIEAPILFEMLSEAVDSKGSKTAREQIAAELTPKITAEVTKQLMAKFNIAGPSPNIGNIPGGTPEQRIHVDGEEAYAKLTPEQKEKWLRGEL